MTWIIIPGLLALLVLVLVIAKTMIGQRNKTIKHLDARVVALEADKVLLKYTIVARSQAASQAAIESAEVSKILQDKLEEMHLVAMRFCVSAKDIYYATSEEDLERWQHPMSVGSKPTVDEWIAMANDISAFAEANEKQWWDKIHARCGRNNARNSLGIKFLQNLLNPHQAVTSGSNGGDGGVALDKDLDLRLLQFLDGLGRVIELDHKDGSVWTVHGVMTMMSMTSFQGRFLRRKLLDLVTHHNEEYMATIDRFPPDIAQYFLRLTVAEQPAITG